MCALPAPTRRSCENAGSVGVSVVLQSREELDLCALWRVAAGGESLRIGRRARARMAAAHRAFQDFVQEDSGRYIYGLTTGYGPSAAKRQSPGESVARRRKGGMPFLGLSFGDGRLPESVTRAMVFATVARHLDGHSALHPDRVARVAAMLDAPLPPVPAHGLTAPGEILPMFDLMGAREAEPGEGYQLHLANGAGFAAALGGLRAVATARRVGLTTRVLALSIEAMQAPLEHFHPDLAPLWGDQYESEALASIWRLLRPRTERARRPFQAPVSYRIVPRVLGQAQRAAAALEEVALAALKSSGANPTFLPPEGRRRARTASTGFFHDAQVPQALDQVAGSWVDLSSLAHRHAVKLHRGAVSHLPDRLLPEGGDLWSGASTTYLEFVPNDFLEEMRRLAQPTLLSTAEPGASLQDDISSTAFPAWRAESRVATLHDRVLAVLAAVASQALHVRGVPLPPGLRRLLTEIREIFPPVTGRRRLGDDCERLAQAFSRCCDEGEAAFGAVPVPRRAPQ